MKKIVLFAIAFLMVNVLFTGPFGLEMGMTLEEIKEKCGWNNVEHIEEDMYKIKPPRSSIFFDTYCVFVDDTFGLHSIAAWTKVMSYKECLLSLETCYKWKAQNLLWRTSKDKEIQRYYFCVYDF